MGQTVCCVGESGFVEGVRTALAARTTAEVISQSDLEGARSALESRRVDCVVSDGSASGATAMEAVTALREVAPSVPVVFAPASGSEALAVRALRTDGVEYVPSSASDRFEEAADLAVTFLEGTPGDGTESGTSPVAESDVRPRSFEHAVEQAGHSIYITDTDGTIRYVNPAFEATTGYAAEQAIGRTPRILKSGEHDRAFYDDLWGTILAGDVWQSELVNRRADGTRYVVNQTIAPIVVDGDIERFVAVNADITDRIEREERLETLHDATREWLEVTTTEGVASRVAGQLSALFAADSVQVYCRDDEGSLRPAARAGSDADVAIVPGDGSDADVATVQGDGSDADVATVQGEDPLLADLEPGETRRFEREDGQPACELLLSAGEYGAARLTSSRSGAFDDTDEVIGRVFTANLEAVLESLENYRALERQNERLDEFAGIVSHDLQNPLSVATGFLDLLEDRIGEDDDVRRIRESLDKMDEIISDVLVLAAEGVQADALEPVSLRRMAEASWAMLETDSASLHVDAEYRTEADPDLLVRLLENLLANAVQHGGPEVTVRVGALEEDEGFYVADDGPGIPRERRGDVFEVGYTTGTDGTGFGLAIVARIAESHGWRVDLEDSDSGGARFVVST